MTLHEIKVMAKLKCAAKCRQQTQYVDYRDTSHGHCMQLGLRGI